VQLLEQEQTKEELRHCALGPKNALYRSSLISIYLPSSIEILCEQCLSVRIRGAGPSISFSSCPELC
jgi:hypothetical protein